MWDKRGDLAGGGFWWRKRSSCSYRTICLAWTLFYHHWRRLRPRCHRHHRRVLFYRWFTDFFTIIFLFFVALSTCSTCIHRVRRSPNNFHLTDFQRVLFPFWKLYFAHTQPLLHTPSVSQSTASSSTAAAAHFCDVCNNESFRFKCVSFVINEFEVISNGS